MKPYFVMTPQAAEVEVIRETQPQQLLLSYYYYRNKRLADVIADIGYRPVIMLDSGAYSAFTKGRNISPIDYVEYVRANPEADYVIALDVIGRPDLTRVYYKILVGEGLDPIPVYHYGDAEFYLDYYIERGCDYIALGGSVPEPDKDKVARWVNYCISRHPGVRFHLLGSNSKKVYGNCPGLESLDASTWIMGAVNGRPKHIPGKSREAKIERAKYNIRYFAQEIEGVTL